MAEGAPLLREYGLILIEGSNPSLSELLLLTSLFTAVISTLHIDIAPVLC